MVRPLCWGPLQVPGTPGSISAERASWARPVAEDAPHCALGQAWACRSPGRGPPSPDRASSLPPGMAGKRGPVTPAWVASWPWEFETFPFI